MWSTLVCRSRVTLDMLPVTNRQSARRLVAPAAALTARLNVLWLPVTFTTAVESETICWSSFSLTYMTRALPPACFLHSSTSASLGGATGVSRGGGLSGFDAGGVGSSPVGVPSVLVPVLL